MWFIVIFTATVTGIITGIFDSDWPPADALLLLSFLTWSLWRQGRIFWPLLILSYLVTSLHLAYRFDASLPVYLSGKDLIVKGMMLSTPEFKVTARKTDKRQSSTPSSKKVKRFLFQVEQCQLAELKQRCDFSGQVKLNWYQDRSSSSVQSSSASNSLPKAGEYWQFRVRLYPIKGFLNPGQSLYRMRQLAKGVSARGYVRSGKNQRLAPAGDLSQWHNRWLEWAQNRVNRLSQDKDVSAFLQALLLADNKRLEKDQWSVLQDTGTVHLVVVSGLHLGVLLMLSLGLSRLLVSFWPAQRWSSILFRQLLPVLILLPIFLLWPVGVALQRALLMLLLLILFRLLAINPSPWRVLALALLLVLLFNPLLLLSPGIYYSVFAVFLLLFFVGQKTQFGLFLRVQLVIFIGLLGVQAFWFNLPGYSAWLSNLLAIPLVTLLILPLSLFTLLWPIPILMEWLGQFIQLFWQWLAFCQTLSLGFWQPSVMAGVVLFLSAILLALPALPGRLPIWCMSLFLLLVPPKEERALNQGQFSVEVLDVGQGLSVWIKTQNTSLLYDTGPAFKSGFAPIQLALLPRLKRSQQTLDIVIVSHDDNDHAGALGQLETFAPFEFYTGQPKRFSRFSNNFADKPENKTLEIKGCVKGTSWQSDNVLFEFLSPYSQDIGGETDNNRSCVLKISSQLYPQLSLLLTGDIDIKLERALVYDQGDKLKTQWLIASHHGSANGSSHPFLRAVDPKGVIYSAGYRNRYGHPAIAVQQRSRALGIEQFSTADMGRIRLLPDTQGDFRVDYQKQQLPLRWLWQK